MIAKLIEALRSGQYPQGRGDLQTHEGFCAIGVACDLYDPSGWDESGFYSKYLNASEYFGICRLTTQLINMNDNDGKSFSEIANYLESTCSL